MTSDERATAVRALDAAKTLLPELVALVGESSDTAITMTASLFCSLSDDGQAKVFVEIARIMETWGAGKADMQAYSIGRHLATCECSSPEARDLIANVAAAAEAPVSTTREEAPHAR